MTKKTTKSARRSSRKPVNGKTTAKRTTIADDAKIVWNKGKEVPGREGTGRYKRIAAVRKDSGKTRAVILKHKVARGSTIAFCVRNGLARIA